MLLIMALMEGVGTPPVVGPAASFMYVMTAVSVIQSSTR